MKYVSWKPLSCWGWLVAAFFVLAGTVQAATTVTLASGLSTAVGIDIDPTEDALYFVEETAGTLKRLQLSPGCRTANPPNCPASSLTTVAMGFDHPQDVAIDAERRLAFVTTADGTTYGGDLWRVDLTTGVKTLVRSLLGGPHQIVLDKTEHLAYMLNFSMGTLFRIDLATGSYHVLVKFLNEPVGLAVTADRSRAFITEQGADRLAEYSLTTGQHVRDVVTGIDKPYYLAWTDSSEVSLYLVDRSPTAPLLRIDRAAGSTQQILTSALNTPSGVVADYLGGAVYLTTASEVLRVDLGTLPWEPVFLGVGNVPFSQIVDGYATTDPSYFFPVTHAPFGGTLNIFGNFTDLGAGATHYRVLLSADGAPPTPLEKSWTAYLWNASAGEYEPRTVAPVTSDGRYEIPANPEDWYPAFLMMRWPSSTNGDYTFTVELFSSATGNGRIPVAGNNLSLKIDNTPPTVEVGQIYVLEGGKQVPVDACEIVEAPADNSFSFIITAHDPNQHLLSYELEAHWGSNQSALVASDDYSLNIDAEGPYQWSGLNGQWVSDFAAQCNCAHTFELIAWKRTINGYNHILRRDSHKPITINNAPLACSP